MKKALIIVLVAFATILSGCGEKGNENKKEEISVKEISRTTLNVEEGKSRNEETDTLEFNLGDRTYDSKSGKVLPYKLRGTITIPKSQGKKPLAIVIHGSHNNEDENVRFDTGFKYLTEYLGENDYVGAALDVQPAYVWSYGDNDDNEKIRAMYKEFINVLKNDSELSQKIDFENIVLIGHSRGADTIIDIANENENIKGILSVAPARLSTERKWPDVNTTIVVPEYDGDVAGLDGIPMFDEMVAEPGRKSEGNLIILEKANHNNFNSNLINNDLELIANKKKLESQLNREEQERFLKNISVDFMDNLFRDEEEGFFKKDSIEPTTMYGLGVKTKSWSSSNEILLNYDNFDDVKKEDLDLKVLNESSFYKSDETKGFNVPMFFNDELDVKKLLNLRWESDNASITIPIDKDLSNKKALIINLALDPSDELNDPNKKLKVNVTLKDKEGNVVKVKINDDVKALSYVEGKLDFTEIFEYKHYFWDSFTPLSMIRVPLELFENIDMKEVDELSLSFDESDSGAVMIEDITVN